MTQPAMPFIERSPNTAKKLRYTHGPYRFQLRILSRDRQSYRHECASTGTHRHHLVRQETSPNIPKALLGQYTNFPAGSEPGLKIKKLDKLLKTTENNRRREKKKEM